MSRDIVQDYDERYNEAYYAWSPFYPLAARDLRFYLGDQWDEQEKQLLFQEGRSQYVINRARRLLNLVTGYQRKHRHSSIVVPVESDDQLTADQRTKVLMYVMRQANGYEMISDCFAGAIKTGINLATLWMDYTTDPINGEIRIGREPYSGFICDPYFTQMDWSDCQYVIRRKYLSYQHAAGLFPKYKKEIIELHKMGWSRDDKFTWLPYQQQPNGEELIAVNEYYEHFWKKEKLLVDTRTGEYTQWGDNEETLKEFIKLYPQLKVVEKSIKHTKRHIILNDVYIDTEIDPEGLTEYPFVPFVAIFEPESDLWGLKMQSLMRCLVDPQKEANRRRSQMVDIVESQINSGWMADENSVVNPQSLFQSSQGKVVWRKKSARPGAVEKIPPAQVPPSMFQLQELFDKDMPEILGVNEASFGEPASGSESGIMMMLRQSAAVVNLQDVFDKMRFSQKMLSQKIIKMVMQWTPEKISKILGEPPSPQFYDLESTRFDISVQEGMLTDTQRQIYFRQLMDLKMATDVPSQGPITPMMLIQAAPIQGKTELTKELSQNMQQQQQQAQEMAQKQQVREEIAMDREKARTIADIGLAKERFARAVSNMGLEDERAARAVDDRASAALDRARAIKELSEIDDNRLVKYLNLILQLEEFNEKKEEEIKVDDVAVAAQGNEVLAQESQQEINPQAMEVLNGGRL